MSLQNTILEKLFDKIYKDGGEWSMFTVFKAIGLYALNVIIAFLFFYWFFDKPHEHDILIPVITGFWASATACGVIQDEHISDKNVEFAHYLIVGIVTSFFWFCQFYDTYDAFQSNGEKSVIISGVAAIIMSWSDLLMAAITFFVIVISNIPRNISLNELKNNISDILDAPQTSIESQPSIKEMTDNLYRENIKKYSQAVELNPDDVEAYYNRGNSYKGLQQYDLALEDFNRAIALKSDYADAYDSRGTTYYYLNQYEQAIKDFDKALLLDSNQVFLYYFRGDSYLNIGQYEKAVQELDKAIQLNSEDILSYTCRGNAYLKLKQYKKAIQDYNKAIKLDSESIFSEDAYRGRGQCYQALGEESKAQADFAKAKKVGFND